ncbi:phosphotransferase [Candidatus Dojkabacteria bacterium]|nr:phosphotransferase [Candidatus Dojkabacteria bacterium]
MKIQDILKSEYGLEQCKLKRLKGGFRNICFKVSSQKGDFVLIVYKDEPEIKKTIINAHLVAKLLQEKEFPTRIPLTTKGGHEYKRFKFGNCYHYVALYKLLEGSTIPWEAYTRRHLKSMGKTFSDMHYALKKIYNSHLITHNLSNWADITQREITAMEEYFKGVEPWTSKKLKVRLNWERIKRVFETITKREATSEKRESILHYDFVRGNILFSEEFDSSLDIYPITGILDFEKTCIGPEIADIARTLAFLIIDCKYKSEETIRKRFLISGYERRGRNKLPFANLSDPLLENLMAFFWLRDFWKFLVHNPYEYLYMNEHYIRTKDRLVKAELITYNL